MEASDVAQITERVQAYGAFVAQGELDRIADLFVHGSVSGDAHPEPAVGRVAVRELYQATLATDGSPRRLRVTTSDLQISGGTDTDTAACASRFEVRAPGAAATDAPLFVGRYADRFARIDGRWEFVHRHVHLDATDEEGVRRAGVNLQAP